MITTQTKELKLHQWRVLEERKELRDKIAKLNIFITEGFNKGIDTLEQVRLMQQLQAMNAYEHILTQRINSF